MTRAIGVPQGEFYRRLAQRFGNDAPLVQLTIRNWLSVLSMDYRSETLKMYELAGRSGCLFMTPRDRVSYHVIMPMAGDLRASFSAFDFGLLATLLAYRELKSVSTLFRQDFAMLLNYISDCDMHADTTKVRRMIQAALERSATPTSIV